MMNRLLIVMFATALAFCGCSKDDSKDLKPVSRMPFSASVRVGSITRALEKDGDIIRSVWELGDKVAIIHGGLTDVVEVTDVDVDSVATLTGFISGTPKDDEPVTIVYPSSAVDSVSGTIKESVLLEQDGTLESIALKQNIRKGQGTLRVSDGSASVYESVSLSDQISIAEFTVYNVKDTTLLDVSQLSIMNLADSTMLVNVNLTHKDSFFYVAMPFIPENEWLSFSATDGVGNYVANAYSYMNFPIGYYMFLDVLLMPTE